MGDNDLPTDAENHAKALEAESKDVQDARKRTVETADEFERGATDAAAQLVASFQRTTVVEENAAMRANR